ncbi:MAG: HAMP domain-containing sensor histidine kinase [Verrucomicrobiales bacterium]|nr:HAMP domain-containing sensor histidine kinase [Verrucomicrobiales bacterium]
MSLSLAISISVLCCVSFAGSYFYIKKTLTRQFDATLRAKVEALVTASEIDEDGFEIDLVVQDFAGFGSYGEDVFVMWNPSGQRIQASPSLDDRILAKPDDEMVGHAARDGVIEHHGKVRMLAVRFTPKDDERGEFRDSLLLVASPSGSFLRSLQSIRFAYFATAGLLIIAIVLLIRRGLRRGLAPLNEFNQQLEGLEPGKSDLLLEENRLPEELQPMQRALQGSLSRLLDSSERERRFSAHAAHELRTPIAEIHSMAELAARWEAEATSENAKQILSVARSMQRLVNQLALLAKIEHEDSGGEAFSPSPLDWGKLVDQELEAWLETAKSRGIQLAIEVESEQAPVMSQPKLWQIMLRNLMSNALEYAPEDSTIRLHVNGLSLRVTNAAPSLSSDDAGQLFERFWRAAGSGHSDAHSGLGLSLVQSCAKALGGEAIATVGAGELRVEVDAGPVA